MIIAVNVAPQDTLKATLEEIAQRLGQAKKYAAIGTPYAVRVFGTSLGTGKRPPCSAVQAHKWPGESGDGLEETAGQDFSVRSKKRSKAKGMI